MLHENVIAKPMLFIDVTVAPYHTHQLTPLSHTILLKGLAQAKITKKSVILFWLPNMTI